MMLTSLTHGHNQQSPSHSRASESLLPNLIRSLNRLPSVCYFWGVGLEKDPEERVSSSLPFRILEVELSPILPSLSLSALSCNYRGYGDISKLFLQIFLVLMCGFSSREQAQPAPEEWPQPGYS